MAALGNVLWHIPFLGFMTALGMFLVGGMLILTVVAAPLGTGLFELGKFYLLPFGNRMVDAKALGSSVSTNKYWRAWGWIMVAIWFPFGAIMAIVVALQCLFLCISIIGIPAALASAKSIPTLFNPVGKKCVSKAVADEIDRRKADDQVSKAFPAQ